MLQILHEGGTKYFIAWERSLYYKYSSIQLLYPIYRVKELFSCSIVTPVMVQFL